MNELKGKDIDLHTTEMIVTARSRDEQLLLARSAENCACAGTTYQSLHHSRGLLRRGVTGSRYLELGNLQPKFSGVEHMARSIESPAANRRISTIATIKT